MLHLSAEYSQKKLAINQTANQRWHSENGVSESLGSLTPAQLLLRRIGGGRAAGVTALCNNTVSFKKALVLPECPLSASRVCDALWSHCGLSEAKRKNTHRHIHLSMMHLNSSPYQRPLTGRFDALSRYSASIAQARPSEVWKRVIHDWHGWLTAGPVTHQVE